MYGGKRRPHFVGNERDDVILGLLQFMMARDIRERCDNSIDGPGAAIRACNRGYFQDVSARAGIRNLDFPFHAGTVRDQAPQHIFLRQIQSPKQVLACQALFRSAQNRGGPGVGKRDVSFGGSDDQAIVDAFQSQIHELSPFDQAGIESANPFHFPFQPARQPAGAPNFGPWLWGGQDFARLR